MMRVCMVFMGWALFVLVHALPSLAQEPVPPEPEREVVAAFEYPGTVIPQDKDIKLDLIVKNNGDKDETVFLETVKTPRGWKAEIRTYSDVVTGVFVAAGERKTFTFEAREEGGDDLLSPGEYTFEVKASTVDNQLASLAVARVTVKAKEEGEKEEDGEGRYVRVTTSYPVLRGPSRGDFEFSVDIYNDTDEDDLFSLRAEAPEGWNVAFKPSYESKYIGSLEIKANLSKSVKVEISPPSDAPIGEHPITVYAACAKGEASKELTVVLTGSHEISCRTTNDVLSLTGRRGEQSTVSIYVINKGSAPQDEITFTSFKPENWEVEFEPDTVVGLPPGELKQVEVKITPAPEALVGDYSVAVAARGEDAKDDIEFRVTVKAPTLWAWVGVGIIIAVIVGLAVMFKALGRR